MRAKGLRPAPRAFSPVQQKIDAVHDQLPPRFLLFDINQLCNLRCTHCDVWKNRPEEVASTRTHERIREIIAEFARLSPYGSVATCGGEPMIDPEEWFWLSRVVHEHGLPFLSVVNGTFIQTPEMAERVILEGADEISISLDHYIPEIHDRMRGVPGAFEKATRALRLLLEARERHPEHHKPIMAMGLIGKTTYRELEAFHDFVLNEIGADKLKLNMLQPSFCTEPKKDRFFEEEGDVNPRRLRKILNRCNKRFSLGMNPVWIDMVVMYFRSISRCKDRDKGWRSQARTDECICSAVDRDIVVDIYGTAHYCFSRDFHNFPLQKPGDLKVFWESRGVWRDEMSACNRCCGISANLRAESGTLAGVRKAENFILKNLGPDALDPKKNLLRDTKSFLEWLNGSVPAPPAACSAEPLFSIILPVHNREADITGCLRSIQLQDFADFEIIVIDDASTDCTADVVTRFAQRDPRIKLIRLETNIGPGTARNIGIHQARGKYIRICDSDDFYPPGSLSAFARRISAGEDDLIVGNLNCWHSRQRKIQRKAGPWCINRDFQSENLMDLPELWAMVHFHRCAFRREFLLENGIEYPAMRRGEDPVYMAEVLAKARSFSLIKDVVYLFHERPRNHQFPYEHIRDAIDAHSRIRRIMSDAGYPELGFFFDCYYSPFSLSHTQLTEGESLKISAQLIEFASRLPVEIFEHPYLNHPACDKVALHHDVLVARNSTPEVVAELMKRGMFCGQTHLRQAEISQLRQRITNLQRQLKPFQFPLRIYRGLKRRILSGRAE